MEAFEEHSSYSSAQFVEHLVRSFPFPIECVQTDNGQEFTKRFGAHGGSDSPTLFRFIFKSPDQAQTDQTVYTPAQWQSGKKSP